jgi:hypothetical protein
VSTFWGVLCLCIGGFLIGASIPLRRWSWCLMGAWFFGLGYYLLVLE